MTEKEKIKAYDEALKKASAAYKDEDRHLKATLERIFPELKESDDDKIKTAILNLLEMWRNYKDYVYGVYVEDAIDWLKKQGKKSSWKPSKEEMDVLYSLSYVTNEYDGHKEDVITHLYQDLKREFFNNSSYENMFSLDNKEDDVRRRSTIQVLEYARSLDAYNQYGKTDIDKDIAWLEKQGKQEGPQVYETKDGKIITYSETDGYKFVDPNFHEGDWVVYNNDVCQIVKHEEGCNKLVTVFGIEKELVNERNLSTARLWTIQDAKDGDVLCYKDEISLYKCEIKNDNKQDTTFGGFIYYCCYDGKNFITNSFYLLTGQDEIDIYPATKEQRDVLIKAMNNAGYKWNDGIKTLEKLVKPNFKVGDMVRHKDTNKDDVYEISKVYDDSYGIAGFNWMILMKYQDQYELVSNKFDPKTLKPFDKVLARRGNENYNVWFPDFISDPPNSTNNKTLCMCVMEDIAMVIPYNDETKHLVGTTDEAPEYYRYWE